MTPRQISILKAINEGHQTTGALMKVTNQASSNISQILRRLDQMKCLKFEVNSIDRRSVIYSLTEIGKTALEQA